MNQTYTDIEIIVHESGSDPRTEAVVAAAGDRRVRYIGTPGFLPMSENWEKALGHASGEYIIILGDDDGLAPGACAAVAEIVSARPADLITWTLSSYYWPQAPDVARRNRLQATVAKVNTVEIKRSRLTLERVYQFELSYAAMPMIYTSFVRNSLIERVRSVHGKYFANEAPDIAAGVVNLLFSEEFLSCTRPLSLSGQSHRSTGYPYVFGDAGQRAAVEQTMFDGLTIHPTMVKSANFRLLTGNYLLVIKERLFPDHGPNLNYRNMLREAMIWVAEAPAGSVQTSPDVVEVARKNEISLADIPASVVPAEPPRPAAGIDISEVTIGCDLDCAALGILDVAGAAQLLEVVLPFNGGAKTLASLRPPAAIELNNQSPVELRFARDGNGVAWLDLGWGEPEQWGVWTVGEAARITISLAKAHSFGIRIRGTMFVHAASPIARMTILYGNMRHEVEATVENYEVDVTLQAPLGDETSHAELRFELAHPQSPLELGISSDPRRLGLALTSITLTRLPE